jgi:hypothetical protein
MQNSAAVETPRARHKLQARPAAGLGDAESRRTAWRRSSQERPVRPRGRRLAWLATLPSAADHVWPLADFPQSLPGLPLFQHGHPHRFLFPSSPPSPDIPSDCGQ